MNGFPSQWRSGGLDASEKRLMSGHNSTVIAPPFNSRSPIFCDRRSGLQTRLFCRVSDFSSVLHLPHWMIFFHRPRTSTLYSLFSQKSLVLLSFSFKYFLVLLLSSSSVRLGLKTLFSSLQSPLVLILSTYHNG